MQPGAQPGAQAGVQTGGHAPVMLREVLDFLAPRPGGRYLDGTLGLAGHAQAVLDAADSANQGEAKPAELMGLDRDAASLAIARERLARFGERVKTRHMAFSDFETALDEAGWGTLDGALVDLGVSSPQLDEAHRGFSFLRDGPLDMRMDPSGSTGGGPPPASRLVNEASFERLCRIIGDLGEEPMAGRIARAIVEARDEAPIESTLQLAAIVSRAYPAKWRATARNHPATRTFQALRMAVNRELEELETFLGRIVDRLAIGGRVAVISFHSLEDRAVKLAFRAESDPEREGGPRLRLLTRRPVTATPEEVAVNPRARSAKLRGAERVDAALLAAEAAARGWRKERRHERRR